MADQAGDSLIVAEYLRRKDAGENVDVAALVEKFPDQADALRSYLQNEEMFSSEAQLSSQFGLRNESQKSTSSMFDESAETVAPKNKSVDGSSKQETMFGRYRIDKELGAGAMGAVYLAFDTKLERPVALKIPKVMALSGDEFLERFKREAQSAAKLMHPNICQVLDFGEENNLPFITMNFIDGHPLSRFVGTEAYKDQNQVAQTVQTIALALEHAHQNNVIHRDLKPGNVLVDLDGNLSVTDFGLARKLDQSEDTRMTQDGVLLGTPAYMAPEQMEGRQDDVGAQSDIYSLGVILFELLTGEIPFKGTITSIIAQVARDEPPKPSSLRSDVDPRLEELCLQMIEKRKEDRPASMQAVADQLAAWLDAGSPEAKEAEAKKKKRLLKYESAKQQIIELLKQGQFSKAIAALEKMSKVKSASVAEYVAWAKKELPNAKAMPKKFKEGIPAIIETAKQLIAKHDYQQAIDILKQLPDDYRNDVVKSLMHQATELQEEADLLLMDLKNAVRKKQYDHIEENLKRYLEIKPGSRFAKRLWESLQTYADIPKGKRNYQFDEKGRLQPLLEDSLSNPLIKIAIAGVAVFGLTLWMVVSYLNSGSTETPDVSGTQNATTTPVASEWVELFNGKDLTGWESYYPGNAIDQSWKVDNGELVFYSKNYHTHLMTSKEFKDFELEFEWKVSKDTNGGVMYKVQKGYEKWYMAGLEYQILDESSPSNEKSKTDVHLYKMRTAAERSAGSLYNIYGTLDKKLNPLGEWNSAKIVVQGNHLEHWLNGQKIVDLEIGGEKWNQSGKGRERKDLTAVKSGHIMLQANGNTEHRYRNLRIRELDGSNLASNNTTKPSVGQDGQTTTTNSEWIQLFNGGDFEGWKGKNGLWKIENGELVGSITAKSTKENSCLISPKAYKDFEIKFDVKMPGSDSNSGLQIRSEVIDLKNFVMKGPQIDMGDNAKTGNHWWGAVYGEKFGGLLMSSDAKLVEKVMKKDEYNSFHIRCLGKQVTVRINGSTVLDSEIPSMPEDGLLGWQLHRGRDYSVWFRNIRIRELNESQSRSVSSNSPPKVESDNASKFTAARPLGELNKTNQINGFPYLSRDGKMIWWTREDRSKEVFKSAIYQAQRSGVDQPFTDVKKVLDGYRLASLSPDGLEIVCMPTYRKGFKGFLCTSRRKSVNDTFAKPETINELTSIGRPKGTSFTADGLNLYISRFSQPAPVFNRVTRPNSNSQWSAPVTVAVKGNLPKGHHIEWPWITRSGKLLYFTYTESSDRTTQYGAIADATADPNRFVNARPLTLNGERFDTHGSRYCEATGELFYTKPIGKSPYTQMELWVATREDSKPVSNNEWQPLFNGKNLDGWRRYSDGSKVTSGWVVDRGALHLPKKGGGDIISEKQYGDFELEFEWKIYEGGNSGVIYRVRTGDKHTHFSGPEYQILDNERHSNGKSNLTSAGSIYGIKGPVNATLKPIGKWNSSKIVAIGNHLEHWLNGNKVVEIDIGSPAWSNAVANRKAFQLPQFAKQRRGHIALQDHGDRVWYRNMRIRELR